MNPSDFYFLFSSQLTILPTNVIKFKGTTRFGKWTLDSMEIEETNLNDSVIYKLGLASDRKSPRYEFIIKTENIEISAEKFGISPVFYSIFNDEIHVSSSIKLLVDNLKLKFKLHINKRFLIEQNLFNYSLFDNTIYEEIKLLPSNSKAIITDRIHIEETFKIEDYFTNSPVLYKKCIHKLVDLFITLNSPKIQDGDYISFTSGFDGRSLLALALYKNKRINTWSFGTASNIDLFLSQQQASILGVDFLPILLDDAGYINEFLSIGKNALAHSAGNTNLLQLHWPYAAKILSGRTRTVVTGMFGSELFRAAHIAGQFISPALVDYFKHIENDVWIDKLKTANSLDFINTANFINEFDSLINDLQNYKKSTIHLSQSQRLYKYLYEESFRKFFGMQFIQSMRAYVNVVNPFLDWEFIKELLKTELAGINNDFFTENPLKRFRGQLFYAELIRKTSPGLYVLPTGKGYAPKDLQNLKGKLRITASFMRKRFQRKMSIPYLDNLGILSGINRFKKDLLNKDVYSEYYDKAFIQNTLKSGIWEKNEMLRDKLVETLSVNLYLKEI